MRGFLQIMAGVTLAASAAGLAGCSAKRVNVVEPKHKEGTPQYIVTKRIVADKKFLRQFNILGENVRTSQSGLLEVQVRLQNRTRKTIFLDYRIDWTDQDMMVVDSPSSRWLQKKVMPGDTVFIIGIAPSPNVKDFYIKLKRH